MSGGYNGPWVVVGPQFVPRPVLLVPVQYYHVPPGHWKQWERARAPHWKEEWGPEWADKRGWKERDRDRGRRPGSGRRPPGPREGQGEGARAGLARRALVLQQHAVAGLDGEVDRLALVHRIHRHAPHHQRRGRSQSTWYWVKSPWKTRRRTATGHTLTAPAGRSRESRTCTVRTEKHARAPTRAPVRGAVDDRAARASPGPPAPGRPARAAAGPRSGWPTRRSRRRRGCGAGRRSRPGVPICSITPSRMTTMRSEIARASSRSWVT